MKEMELSSKQLAYAVKLHNDSIVVDMLCTTNPAQPTPIIDGKNALIRTIDGGLAAINNTVAEPSMGFTFRDAIKNINDVYRLVQAQPDKALIVHTTADIERAKAERKLGIILGFQGASPLEEDWVNTLPVFQKLGVRVIQLTYNEKNLLGSGCTEPRDHGLTAYGQQVVRALNLMGVIVDLSHVGESTARDAIELSSDPVIFSHSNAAALSPHVRNISDDTIRALASKGGVIGLCAWSVILGTDPTASKSLQDLMEQVDYVVNLVGIDHVGIGSDRNEHHAVRAIPTDFQVLYSYMLDDPATHTGTIEGFHWMHEFPNITLALVGRGYSDDDIRKILGGNFLRIARQVWDKKN